MDSNSKTIKEIIYNFNLLQKFLLQETDSEQLEKNKKYLLSFEDWLKEQVVKNCRIKTGKKFETGRRPRQRVFWTEFGINIGSEFSFTHFGVVIKEFDHTVLVVPLSTEKEDELDYKNIGNCFVPIDIVDGMPYDKKSCYALVNQMQSISKARLGDYKDEFGKYHQITLSDVQMQKIFDVIKIISEQQIFVNNISKNS